MLAVLFQEWGVDELQFCPHVGSRGELEYYPEGQQETRHERQVFLTADDLTVPVAPVGEQKFEADRQDDIVSEDHPGEKERGGQRDQNVGERPAHIPDRGGHERPQLVEDYRDGQQEGREQCQLYVRDEGFGYARYEQFALQLRRGSQKKFEDLASKDKSEYGGQEECYGDLDDPGPEFAEVFDQGHAHFVARFARTGRESQATGHL